MASNLSVPPSRRQIYVRGETPALPTQDFESSDLNKFHQSLPGYSPTPLLPLDNLAKELNLKKVFVKDESSRFGLPSFKLLGASWGVFRAVAAKTGLSSVATLEEASAMAQKYSLTLFAATDGNHGRAVAYMAKMLGIPAKIYVPRTVHEYTRSMIISEGASVTVVPSNYDTAVVTATKAAQLAGGILVQDTAFNGYEEIPAWIIDGYSTLMHEVEMQLASHGTEPTAVIIPMGVGSIAEAVVKYCKAAGRNIQVILVEPDTAACLYKSLKAQKSVSVQTSHTIMNGMDCGTVSSSAWPVLRDHTDYCVTISDLEAHSAVQYMASQGLNSGPCGSSGLAALRRIMHSNQAGVGLGPESVVVLLSTEGNRPYPIPCDVSSEDPAQLTSILANIDSSNPSLSTGGGEGEGKIANYICAWLEHRDIETHRIEPVLGRPSIVAITRGNGGGRSIMLNGHTDTASLASCGPDTLSGRFEDGRIYGRGALNSKAGVAASMVALAKHDKSATKLRGNVIMTAVADGQCASRGTTEVLEAGWTADAAIVTKPTMTELVCAHKGLVWAEVDIQGVAAHGSNPGAGVDAILSAGAFLGSLEKYGNELPADDILGRASLHCGLIRGGEEPSSYPALCTITIEFRIVKGQTSASILEDVQDLLKRLAAQRSDFIYSTPRIVLERPWLVPSKDHPLMHVGSTSISEVLNKTSRPQASNLWCDAALLSEAGIPSVVFGPSGAGLHSNEEWAEADSVRKVERILSCTINDFCA